VVDLDPRKQEILDAIIEAYVTDAEPVGSERLAQRFRLRASPATIRNEMAALEEMGYLSHPHTSAGRVPTDRGYRVYVDALHEESPLSLQDRRRVQRALRPGEQRERLPEDVARALAAITEYASLVAAPGAESQVFQHLHLIPLTERQVLAVIVTDAGIFHGKTFVVHDPIEPEALDRLSRIVSQRLQGYALTELTGELLSRFVHEAAWQHRIVEELAAWLRHRLPRLADGRVHIEGTANILKQPEFRDARSARPVLSALEREEVLTDLLRATGGHDIWVTIGREHRYEELHGTSVVAAAYRLAGHPGGALGIVGPTRMNYLKVMALVRYLAGNLSELLGESS
jgi:heat-inducible transcriptional repressor